MELKITYKNGMVREIDTNTYVALAPSFIRDEQGNKIGENETLASEFRLRWDLIQQIGLVAEIFIYDNNFSSQCQDQVIQASYNQDAKLYLSPMRPAKVLRIIEKNDLQDIIEIMQDGETKIWRDIDGNLINFDSINRISKVNSNYSLITAAFEYLNNKWASEDKGVIGNLQKIENLLGIDKGRLSKIIEEKDRLDREQRLKEAEKALETLRMQNELQNKMENNDDKSNNNDKSDNSENQHQQHSKLDMTNENPVVDIQTSHHQKNNAR